MSEPQHQLLRRAHDQFAARFGVGEHSLGWAPGRVNLIGEHTDYNNGYVMPMIIDRGICVALRPRQDDIVRVYADSYQQSCERTLGQLSKSDPNWISYLHGVAIVSQHCGWPGSGFDALVVSNMPSTGGVSSSAALTTATSLALQHASGWIQTPPETALACQRVEHEFVNVMCGVMDQIACRICESERALFLNCRDLSFEHIPFPLESARILVVDSGVERTLSGSDYNARNRECQQALAALKPHIPDVEDLGQLDISDLDTVTNMLQEPLSRRARHVISENNRVLKAKQALERLDLATLGQLMVESHMSLRDDFEVSIPELDYIVDSAVELPGVMGARLTGAGFGGNAIVLARSESATGVQHQLAERFNNTFGYAPKIHCIHTQSSAQAWSNTDLF